MANEFLDGAEEEDTSIRNPQKTNRKFSDDQISLKESIDTLKDASVTHRDFMRIVEVVDNKSEIIEAQISNIMARKNVSMEKYRKFIKQEAVQKMIKDSNAEIAPYKALEMSKENYIFMDEAFSWKSIEVELFKIKGEKLAIALSAVKAMDIEKEVTEGIREVSKQFMEFFKEIMMQKMDAVELQFRKLEEKIDMRFEKMNENQDKKMNSFEHEVLRTAMITMEKIGTNSDGKEKQFADSIVSFKNLDMKRDAERLKAVKEMKKIIEETPEIEEPIYDEVEKRVDKQKGKKVIGDYEEYKEDENEEPEFKKPEKQETVFQKQSQMFECPYCHRKDFWSERALQIHMNTCDLKKNEEN